MSFNLSKCEHLIITNKRSPIISDCHNEGCTINKVDSCKHLGVTITNNLSWSKHIASIVSKAHSVRGFLQRNLRQSSSSVKAKAYFIFVRPTVEYASVIWSPYTTCDITVLEAVQHKAARFVWNDFSSYSSVTAMMNNLKWSLESKQARLIMFYKIIHGIVGRQYFNNKLKLQQYYLIFYHCTLVV